MLLTLGDKADSFILRDLNAIYKKNILVLVVPKSVDKMRVRDGRKQQVPSASSGQALRYAQDDSIWVR